MRKKGRKEGPAPPPPRPRPARPHRAQDSQEGRGLCLWMDGRTDRWIHLAVAVRPSSMNRCQVVQSAAREDGDGRPVLGREGQMTHKTDIQRQASVQRGRLSSLSSPAARPCPKHDLLDDPGCTFMYRGVYNYSCLFKFSRYSGCQPATLSHCLPIGHFRKDWQKLLQLSRNHFTPLCTIKSATIPPFSSFSSSLCNIFEAVRSVISQV